MLLLLLLWFDAWADPFATTPTTASDGPAAGLKPLEVLPLLPWAAGSDTSVTSPSRLPPLLLLRSVVVRTEADRAATERCRCVGRRPAAVCCNQPNGPAAAARAVGLCW